ncbi:MAG: non-homologous end-joining DNA ligase [Bacteroidota bacterium]
MSSDVVYTKVDGQKIKLTNLSKVLYPSKDITKANVIHYHLDMAEILLRYVGSRPLTVIRYPDGIGSKGFYSKDKPDWTPDWIPSLSVKHDDKSINYIVPEDRATLVWLANLACLELHPMQYRSGFDQRPDLFIVDLDPDEGLEFREVKDAAFRLRAFLEDYDYTPFVKTSGGKGLHLVVPILPNMVFADVSANVKALAKRFVGMYRDNYTLQLSKEKRKGKILIDIYRNYISNTTVAPYSLRGKPGAPISMPILWDELHTLESSQEYNFSNYRQRLTAVGDVWAAWRDHEAPLADHQGATTQVFQPVHDDRLKEYHSKRDFGKTPEPLPRISQQYRDQYVIQLHNASNLHYDLRLEDDGILLSWAIPKGLPYSPGQKRLAIQTEDHPIKYLSFEGVIPPGQYGAGVMWIMDNGRIEWLEKKKGTISFRLISKRASREFKLYQINKESQWLIQTTDELRCYNWSYPAKPMLATAAEVIPKSDSTRYEVKWDGIRVLVYVEEDQVRIRSRSGRDITAQFSELLDPSAYEAEQAVLDGEIVVLDDAGKPLFHEVISRMHAKAGSTMSKKETTLYLFDMISLDGFDITDEPLHRRRSLLETILQTSQYVRMSKTFDDGQLLFDAIEAQNMEGIMAKDQNSRYHVGERSLHWKKVKVRRVDQCLIIGYTVGKGDRCGYFGALHLAKRKDNRLVYMGKVGTGFNQDSLNEMTELFSGLETTQKPIPNTVEEESQSVWITPKYSCKIKYASMSSNQTYREPVFIQLNTSS